MLGGLRYSVTFHHWNDVDMITDIHWKQKKEKKHKIDKNIFHFGSTVDSVKGLSIFKSNHNNALHVE